MTQKIKVTAEMEIEDDMALDGLSMDTSLGLLGTIKSWDIDYEEKTEIDLSEKNNCNICNKKDKLQKRNNKWYCPKCYLSEVKQKEEKPKPKLTYDEIKEKYFVKDINIDTVRKEIISAFMTQESDKFHNFAVEAIDSAVLKEGEGVVPDQDLDIYTEILNDEYYSEVLATKELKDKHGIE